jgi:hypothetical protein
MYVSTINIEAENKYRYRIEYVMEKWVDTLIQTKGTQLLFYNPLYFEINENNDFYYKNGETCT